MAFQNSRCCVLEVPVSPNLRAGDLNAGVRELLPWADPYIATLLRKHQLEEMLEHSRMNARPATPVSEASPPLGARWGQSPERIEWWRGR